MDSVRRRSLTNRSMVLSDAHEYNVNLDTRELFLHQFLEENSESGCGVDYRMANVFIKNLRYLESLSHDEILIHMTTDGGEWPYGMAIYDAISFSPCHVTILAYAHARSMSSIILQAADRRVMTPNCDFMIHYGSMDVGEINTISFHSESEWGKKLDERMLTIYVNKCCGSSGFLKWSRNRIKTFLDRKMKDKQEWYLTAQDAVHYGFADAVLGFGDCLGLENVRCS